jgi:C-terminal processing protease CtpA/Prc
VDVGPGINQPATGLPSDANDPTQANSQTVDQRTRFGIRLGFDFNGDLTITDLENLAEGERLGLRRGDRIISIGGREFYDLELLETYLSGLTGGRVPVTIWRNGKREYINLYYYDRVWYHRPGFYPNLAALGVAVGSGQTDGVRVQRVYQNSPAHSAGLQTGDLISAVNNERHTTASGFIAAISSMRPGEQVVLDIWRNGRTFRIAAPLSNRQIAFDEGFVSRNQIAQNANARSGQTVFRPILEDEQTIDQLQQKIEALTNQVEQLKSEVSSLQKHVDGAAAETTNPPDAQPVEGQ